jgi:cytochrome c553
MQRIALLTLVLVVSLMLAAVAFSGSAYGDLDGKQILLTAKCNTCHGVSTAGIEPTIKSEKMQGPDLAGVGERVESDQLLAFLRQKAEVGGKKHKVAFKGSDEELGALVAWLEDQKKK